jgi:hypothetical protein
MLGEGIQGGGCGVRLCTRQKEAATRLRWRRAIEAWDPRHHTHRHRGVMCGVIELCERWREQSLARCLASLEHKRGWGERWPRQPSNQNVTSLHTPPTTCSGDRSRHCGGLGWLGSVGGDRTRIHADTHTHPPRVWIRMEPQSLSKGLGRRGVRCADGRWTVCGGQEQGREDKNSHESDEDRHGCGAHHDEL